MILAHRIRLAPNAEQEAYFVKACGVARFAYNWALAEWQRRHREGDRTSEMQLRKALNAVKDAEFPWMREVTKSAPQYAIRNLGHAYANFFADLSKYRLGQLRWNSVRVPRFKKRGPRDSFRADNGTDKRYLDAVRINGKSVKLPIIGWVRMREEVRFAGQVKSVTISRRADACYASFCIDTLYTADKRTDDSRAGIDLGIVNLATDSVGRIFPSPKPLRKRLKQLKRLSRSLSRKQHVSRNWAKAKTKLARLHRRIADIRVDALHKLTTYLTRYATVVIEDLDVNEMMRDRRLSRSIADVGFGIFRRQMEYKAAMAGSRLVVSNRWYPSSKLCSACDTRNDKLALLQRTWTCESCGAVHDRDLNAAVNLARYRRVGPGKLAEPNALAAGLPRGETAGTEAGRDADASHNGRTRYKR